ncbi:MAG: hypothetical protein ACRC7N_07370 [Clostridium sp.]
MRAINYIKSIEEKYSKDEILKIKESFIEESNTRLNDKNTNSKGLYGIFLLLSLIGVIAPFAVGVDMHLVIKLLYVVPCVVSFLYTIIGMLKKGDNVEKYLYLRNTILMNGLTLLITGTYLLQCEFVKAIDSRKITLNIIILVVYIILTALISANSFLRNFEKKFNNLKTINKLQGPLFNIIVSTSAILGSVATSKTILVALAYPLLGFLVYKLVYFIYEGKVIKVIL